MINKREKPLYKCQEELPNTGPLLTLSPSFLRAPCPDHRNKVTRRPTGHAQPDTPTLNSRFNSSVTLIFPPSFLMWATTDLSTPQPGSLGTSLSSQQNHRILEGKGFVTATCFRRNRGEHGTHRSLMNKHNDEGCWWSPRKALWMPARVRALLPAQAPQGLG